MDAEESSLALKRCSKCGEDKSLEEFYPHKLTKDRKQSCCKVCSNAATKKSKTRNKCVDCGKAVDYQAERCVPCSKTGAHHPRWLGGRHIEERSGYVMLRINKKTVAEHKYVMEQMLGREMISGESVHHKNGQRADNRPENLELWSKSQPAGQRVEDKVAWAVELLKLYDPGRLA